jgi:hypothetical protein
MKTKLLKPSKEAASKKKTEKSEQVSEGTQVSFQKNSLNW